jgi:hypothetical protein
MPPIPSITGEISPGGGTTCFRRSSRDNALLHTRPGTTDQLIYEWVVEANEYGLPDRFEPSDIVVDIGVHIGAFAHAALIRGCGHVHGVEADLENVRVATENLRRYIDEGAVTLTYGAAGVPTRMTTSYRFRGTHPLAERSTRVEGASSPSGTAHLYPRSTLTRSYWVRHGG